MTDQLNLLATSEFSAISLASQRDFHMMASIKAPAHQSDIRDRAPIDLVAVIDKSGSMAGEKIDLVKKTCNFILKQLTSSDRFSVVSYDTHVTLEFGLTNMTPAHKKSSAAIINKIDEGTSTNLSGGLLAGLDQLINDTSSSKSPVSSVFLLTDGQANAGITSGKELAKVVQDKLKKMSNPCSIFTFGFGADHDEGFLTQISDQGSGMYYFVKDEEAISTAFADALGGLLSVVAQKIQMTITPVNGVRIQKTLGVIAPPKKKKNAEEDDADEEENGTEADTDMVDDEKTVLDLDEQKKTKTRGRKAKKAPSVKKEAKPIVEEISGSTDPVTIDIGDLYSEEGRDVVLKLYVPETESATDSFELAKVKLTYFNPRSNNESCEASISCTVERKDEISAEEQVRDLQVDKQINRLLAAEVMESAKTEASNGNLEKARQMLQDTMSVIKQSVSSKDPLCQDLVADLQQIFDSLKSEQTWNNFGAKEVAWIASAHKRQRGAGKGGKSYQNESKKKMVAKAKQMSDNDFNDDEDEENEDDEDDMDMTDHASTNRKRKFDQISVSRGKGGKGLGVGKPAAISGKGAVVGKAAPAKKEKPLKKSTKHVDKKYKYSSAPQSY